MRAGAWIRRDRSYPVRVMVRPLRTALPVVMSPARGKERNDVVAAIPRKGALLGPAPAAPLRMPCPFVWFCARRAALRRSYANIRQIAHFG